MSLITKKDMDVLLCAGFSEEDLGLVEGGICGVQIYQTPNDYFANELIENAAEAGEVDLMDEFLVQQDDDLGRERYDHSRKGLYDDQEYAGNEDTLEGIPVNLREQVEWLKSIKLGRMSVWQRKGKKGYEWPVKNLKVEIPEDDRERFNRLPKDYQKELWISYAKDEWKKLWSFAAGSLRESEIEERMVVKTAKGYELKLLIIAADNVRKAGYTNLPADARWISMVYFENDRDKN